MCSAMCLGTVPSSKLSTNFSIIYQYFISNPFDASFFISITPYFPPECKVTANPAVPKGNKDKNINTKGSFDS